jgi:hypothetical protein
MRFRNVAVLAGVVALGVVVYRHGSKESSLGWLETYDRCVENKAGVAALATCGCLADLERSKRSGDDIDTVCRPYVAAMIDHGTDPDAAIPRIGGIEVPSALVYVLYNACSAKETREVCACYVDLLLEHMLAKPPTTLRAYGILAADVLESHRIECADR